MQWSVNDAWHFAEHGQTHSLKSLVPGLIAEPRKGCFCSLSQFTNYPLGKVQISQRTSYEISFWCCTFVRITNCGLRPIWFFQHNASYVFQMACILQSLSHSVNPSGPFAGVRIGEAKNPGPSSRIRCAITNPTTVVSKINQYVHLHDKENVALSFLSETAATKLSQKVFNAKLRSHKLRAVWSHPVPDQFQRLDGRDSLKGKASGVGFVTSLPIRPAVGTIMDEMYATSRIQHAILTVGPMHFQIVVVYGLPATNPQAQETNNRLLEQAIEAVGTLTLPAIIGGDFNTDPMQLPAASQLKSQGFCDLLHLSQARFGKTLEPTCKESTNPDNAICCPRIQQWITNIQVYQQQLFDAHKVVIFDINIPHAAGFRSHMPLPKSWLTLPIDEQTLQSTYDIAHERNGSPRTLEKWGECVEFAVDLAYRDTQQHHGIGVHSTKPLPASFRGRCKPRKVVRTPIRVLTPPTRPGDFQPIHEITTFGTLKRVVQLRRIQSLMRRTKKYANETALFARYRDQLNHEWKVICQNRSFPHGFALWAQEQPEIGPLPLYCPNYPYLYHLEQIVKFYVQADIASEAMVMANKRKYQHYLDAHDNGLSTAFATIKESPMPLVESLQTTLVDEGILASHIDDVPLEVFVNEPEKFTFLDKIFLNQIPCRLNQRTADSLLLTPLQPVNIQDSQIRLEQHQYLHDTHKVFEALTSYWLPFWHTGAHITACQTQQFEEFLQCIPQTFPEVVVDVGTTECWVNALTSMKSKTARGVDGFAVDELRMLPISALTDLRRLCMEVYSNGFPDWFMVARTIALSKVPGTPASHQVRPISILAVIYRLWGRVICQQIIAQLSNHLPPQLTGFLRGRGPLQAAYQQQFDIETAHWLQMDLSGISIDLIKCFNTIAREAGFLALARIKLPPGILVQYANSIQVLSRVWLIGDECSPPVPSSKGFPEGDSFSVIVILAISFGWVKFLETKVPRVNLTAYADNWGWSLQEPKHHKEVLRLTVLYAGCALMQVDWHKTWAWTTTRQHVVTIKTALRAYLLEEDFQLVMNQCDLGCQMTYRGPPKLGSQKKRFANAKERFKRLASCKGSLSEKVRLAVGGAYSVALFGVEMLPVGSSHFDALRSQTAEGIYGTSVSRNSALALLCTPGLIDPQLQAIVNAIRVARQFLLKSSGQQATRFLAIASRHTGIANRCRGPAACLKYYLLKLGWSLTKHGDLHISAFTSVNLFRTSFQAILRHAIASWQEHLLLFFTDRQGIQRLPAISRVDTIQVIRKFVASQQTTLIREVAASFQTKQQQAAWDVNTDPRCEFCGQVDTRHHRVFTCSLFSDLRSQFQETLDHYEALGSSIHELPVIHVLPDFEFNRHLQWIHPEATIPQPIIDKLQQLAVELREQGTSIHFYTDGSCMHQESPMSRYAAYSIVLDCCLTDHERQQQVTLFRSSGQIPSSFQKVTSARVTGEQGIHRAEIYALVILAESFDNVVVHVDSSVAINVATRAQAARRDYDLAGIDDFDLALRLRAALVHKQFTFLKVRAHTNPLETQDHLECYAQLGNSVANDFAQDVCKHHMPHLVKQYAATHTTLTLEKFHLEQMFQFLLKSTELRKAYRAVTIPPTVTPTCERTDYCKLFQEWTVTDGWTLPPYQACKWECSTWGRSIMQVMYQWLRHCCWPKVQVPEDTFGVSWVELATSFFIYSGIFLPIKRSLGDGKEGLIPIMSTTDLETFSVKYSEMVRTFITVFQQLTDLTDTLTWPQHPRGLVRSLYVLGGRTQPAGVKFRCAFYKQSVVVPLLQQYLVKTRSLSFDETPELPLEAACITASQLRSELAGGWKQRQQRFHHAASYIRHWRTQTQQRLIFG